MRRTCSLLAAAVVERAVRFWARTTLLRWSREGCFKVPHLGSPQFADTFSLVQIVSSMAAWQESGSSLKMTAVLCGASKQGSFVLADSSFKLSESSIAAGSLLQALVPSGTWLISIWGMPNSLLLKKTLHFSSQ